MKKIWLILVITLISGRGYSQTIIQSKFYASFNRAFFLSERNLYEGYNGFHSIKLTTNSKGQVITYEPSLSMTERLKRDVSKAFQKADKDGLISWQYKNKTLILPFFIISSKFTPSEEENMWKFKTDPSPSTSKEILLPPYVYYLNPKIRIDN